jgi:hypothetical protein
MDGFLPGLAAKYGKGQPVSLRFLTTSAPKSIFDIGKVGAYMTARIEFIVNNETAVALCVNNADALVSPSLSNFTLFMEILKFDIKEIQMISSLIGEVNTEELLVFLNVLFRITIPFVNKFLQGGFDLPTEYFGVLSVKQAEFKAFNGYIEASFVPEFN